MAEQFMFPVLVLSAYSDMRWKKIPNLLIMAGGIGCLMVRFQLQGVNGIKMALFSLMFTILVFFPIFLMGGIGAGDIKLFAIIAAMHGMERLLWVLVVLFVIAGGCGIRILIRQGVLCKRMEEFLNYAIGRCRAGGRNGKYRCYDRTYTIILAPITGLAYELVACMQ